MEFQSIRLQYHFKGVLITGTLKGSILKWQFETNSKVFTHFFPLGFINHKTILKGVHDRRLPIVEATLTAIDNTIEQLEIKLFNN